MIEFSQKGDFKKVNNWLEKLKGGVKMSKLDRYGQQGVEALSLATPVSTGKTANSWYYDIERGKDSVKITWYNSNVVDGANVALLLQYGHATKSGYWISGLDYINPALEPIFIKMAKEFESEVSKL